MESLTALLRGLYFFRALSEEELSRIGEVCREENVAPGVMICREGTPADRFFIIVDGQV